MRLFDLLALSLLLKGTDDYYFSLFDIIMRVFCCFSFSHINPKFVLGVKKQTLFEQNIMALITM